ncbi:EAL domain-containing protein [Stenotrophomonas sp. NPDC077659]|uniref:EAL domain-containing protein n=1 Tax=Stenotrophomonas sp. NPDC077659 TaxID=3390694 RepID=UPI003D005E7C
MATALGATTVCLLAMLAVAQAILYVRDKEASEAIADAAVARSEAISLARRAAAEQAARIGKPPCSAADIDALREIAFRSSYISDIGRIHDGRLVCSALWGSSRPYNLPAPHLSAGPIQLWHASDLVGSPYAGSNLIAEGDSFTVSSPSAFERLDPARTSAVSIQTRDSAFAFRSLSPVGTAANRSAVHAKRCSDVANVCVHVVSPRHLLAELPAGLLAGILAAGASVGALLAFLMIRHRTMARQTIQQRLAVALRRDEIELAYQPLRRIGSHQLLGFEALSRWRPSGDDEIPPTIFVPIAHRLGLSPELFRYVLVRAMNDLSAALRQHRHLYVSINAEPVDMAQESIVRYVSSVTDSFGVAPEQLRIEITEREERVSAIARNNMEALSVLGYRFLIDDFGTGSANFSRLAQSPFQGIKIDRMFVAAINEESPLCPVLPGMYRIARELGLEVIAEGVETEEQDLLLARIAPEAIGQGWHYGYPLSLAEALAAIEADCPCSHPGQARIRLGVGQ